MMPSLSTLAALAGVFGTVATVVSAALSTWLRSRRNARKLDALLAAFGVDPDDPPEYDLGVAVHTDGGGEDDA